MHVACRHQTIPAISRFSVGATTIDKRFYRSAKNVAISSTNYDLFHSKFCFVSNSVHFYSENWICSQCGPTDVTNNARLQRSVGLYGQNRSGEIHNRRFEIRVRSLFGKCWSEKPQQSLRLAHCALFNRNKWSFVTRKRCNIRSCHLFDRIRFIWHNFINNFKVSGDT